MREKLTVSRIAAYLLGLLLLALGIAASVRSNLGSSPVASVPYMFSLTTGVELGTTTFLWQSFLVFCQFLILRRDFSPWTLLQLITGFIFGYFNTFAGWIFRLFPAPQGVFMRGLFTCIGFVVGGFGVWLYSSADLVNMPSEGIVMVIARKLGKPFHIIKICFDVCSVVLAGVCCLIFIHSLGSVGIGTVVIAIMLGTMVGVYTRIWGKTLQGIFDKDKRSLLPAKKQTK
ncbi:MAG: YitT family protein [Oscillospiraceae bacterium]